MKILGICHDVFACSACVVEDGRVVVAIPEERLDRVKQSRVFPTLAIRRCLEETGLEMGDLDAIAVAWHPGIEAETTPGGYLQARRWRSEHLVQVPSRLLQMTGRTSGNSMTHADLWQGAPPVTYVSHYLSHIGNAAFLSPFESCATLVLDGRGERATGLLASVDGTRVEVLEEVRFPHSIGLFYSAVTQFLGFRPDSAEWKVMALASFAQAGEYLEPMRRLLTVDDSGSFSLSLEEFSFYNFWDRRLFSDSFVATFGEPRAPASPITERHQRIAAALQQVFEERVREILQRLHERTGLDRLVVSGGCFMNSVFNGKISRLTPFSDCFITSCPDDSGTSVGAALYLEAQETGKRSSEPCRHDYWGVGFTDAECLEAASRYKLPNTEVVAEPAEAAAADLVAGRLIGWFQGRAEFGQRALGNRSILADPRNAEAKDLVNSAVKFRESFRPFAPAVLAERAGDYFEHLPARGVPFMERVLPFRDQVKEQVPAVVHTDGSGRLQTVDENSSTRFQELIRHFAAATSVPMVLNTSFNLNGEPIVNSPEDAIRTFFSCGLDVLYLGNARVAK